MIHDIYSKRLRKASGAMPDVYRYDQIPKPLRIQIQYIVEEASNMELPQQASTSLSRQINSMLRREYGVHSLANKDSGHQDTLQFFLTCGEVEKVLDVIELWFFAIDSDVRRRPAIYGRLSMTADAAIQELNARFREHAVGYQFENRMIVRIDSELIHDQVVRPLLGALQVAPFTGALGEFTSAHEHYRHGNYKECLNDCNKAFESLMKAVCTKRGWNFDSSATAKALIKVLFDNQFFPKYSETQLSALRNLLESGVPTIRNKNSGHGQGVAVTTVPEELATYCLHLTATNLLYIVKLA